MTTIARDQVREPLYAIVPYFNPWRSKARAKHAERAIKHFHDSGAVIILVEAAFNRREHEFADSGLHGMAANCKIIDDRFTHQHIRLVTKDELWLKENMVGIGAQHLPYDWEQACWPDADIHFTRPNWVGEAIQKLQHGGSGAGGMFLQMFTQATDLGPNYEILPSQAPSFVEMWKTGKLGPNGGYGTGDPSKPCEVPWPGWPGLAWGCNRRAWDAVGGLFDVAVWGGGDYDMGFAMIERASEIHLESHPNYQKLLLEWEDRCRWGIRRNVGVMEGAILHHWHGQKNLRRYTAKRKLMAGTAFDPLKHLKRDSQGLWQLHDDGSENFIRFRDVMRQIAKGRNEDSIDVGPNA
jgi:hypothetical protein